jgi:hypothetical protein
MVILELHAKCAGGGRIHASLSKKHFHTSIPSLELGPQFRQRWIEVPAEINVLASLKR